MEGITFQVSREESGWRMAAWEASGTSETPRRIRLRYFVTDAALIPS